MLLQLQLQTALEVVAQQLIKRYFPPLGACAPSLKVDEQRQRTLEGTRQAASWAALSTAEQQAAEERYAADRRRQQEATETVKASLNAQARAAGAWGPCDCITDVGMSDGVHCGHACWHAFWHACQAACVAWARERGQVHGRRVTHLHGSPISFGRWVTRGTMQGLCM